METTFERFLKDAQTVYHLNGQQTVTLNADTARGTCYCLITLIGMENGKKIKTTIGACYQDEYVREDNRWLVAKRVGTFEWEEKGPIS